MRRAAACRSLCWRRTASWSGQPGRQQGSRTVTAAVSRVVWDCPLTRLQTPAGVRLWQPGGTAEGPALDCAPAPPGSATLAERPGAGWWWCTGCLHPPPAPLLLQAIYDDYKMRREGLLLALIDGAWLAAGVGHFCAAAMVLVASGFPDTPVCSQRQTGFRRIVRGLACCGASCGERSATACRHASPSAAHPASIAAPPCVQIPRSCGRHAARSGTTCACTVSERVCRSRHRCSRSLPIHAWACAACPPAACSFGVRHTPHCHRACAALAAALALRPL